MIISVAFHAVMIQLSEFHLEFTCFDATAATQVPEAVKKHAQHKAKKVALVSDPVVKNNFGTISEPPSSAN